MSGEGATPVVFTLTNVHKAFGERVLLDDVTFGVHQGDRIGLIGRNGAGKSTLLRMLSDEEGVDGGRIVSRTGLRVGVLEQVPRFPAGATVRDVLEGPFAAVREAIARYEHAARHESADADVAFTDVERLGGWDWEHRLQKAASTVGFPPERMDEAVAPLSGGEQRRVALARLVLEAPDLVLLDEPTNHLDATTIEWLEGWLQTTTATVVLVTHDRYFLDRSVTRIVELREASLHGYDGTYTDYLEARAEEEALRQRTEVRRLGSLKRELAWARRQPKARTTKSKSRLDRIDATKAEVRQLQVRTDAADIAFGQAPRLGKTILELVDLHFGYPEGPPLIERLTMLLRRGERVGLLGPNGAGKSTLLKLVLGDLQPTAGTLKVGKNTQVAYLDQHRSFLDDTLSVRKTLTPDGGDHVYVGGHNDGRIHVITWLERFAFPKRMHELPVGQLSGGERNRLSLARFLCFEANLLILDEPTNDLDLDTLRVLEDALVAFEGCVLVVSHDRYFLDKVATRIVAFEREHTGRPTVTVVDGDYTTYRRVRLAELEAQARLERQRQRDAKAAQNASEGEGGVGGVRPRRDDGPKPLTYSEKHELEGLEAQVEQAEAAVAGLEARLADPAVWAGGGGEGRRVELELAEARARAAAIFARWEELAERAEATS